MSAPVPSVARMLLALWLLNSLVGPILGESQVLY